VLLTRPEGIRPKAKASSRKAMAKAPIVIRPMTEPIWTTQTRQTKAHEKLVSITNSTHLFQLCFDQENISNQTTVPVKNKKAVLPQGNRAMLQVFFSVEVRQQHSLQV